MKALALTLCAALAAVPPAAAIQTGNRTQEEASAAQTNPGGVFDGRTQPNGTFAITAGAGDPERELTASEGGPARGFRAGEVPSISGSKVMSADEPKKEDKPPPPTDWKAVRGAITGMLAGALIGLAVGGPIGMAVGALVGLFIGALAGKMGWFRRR